MNDSAELRRITEVERQAALDDLLSRWHWWRAGDRVGEGYSAEGLATHEYQASRQYDDQNGALDAAIENNIMEQVEYEISELGEPWHSAVCMHARNLYVGVSVFRSPRISPEAHAEIVHEGREKLIARLILAGVME